MAGHLPPMQALRAFEAAARTGSLTRAAEALHLGKGIFERDLEKFHPDPNTEIIMYCGGGFRSALTRSNASSISDGGRCASANRRS